MKSYLKVHFLKKKKFLFEDDNIFPFLATYCSMVLIDSSYQRCSSFEWIPISPKNHFTAQIFVEFDVASLFLFMKCFKLLYRGSAWKKCNNIQPFWLTCSPLPWIPPAWQFLLPPPCSCADSAEVVSRSRLQVIVFFCQNLAVNLSNSLKLSMPSLLPKRLKLWRDRTRTRM